MLRPEAVVLSDTALVPAENRIKPSPNQFTHEVVQTQPFFYRDVSGSRDGEFPGGTRVVLMTYDGGSHCWVVDGRGLYVQTAYQGLRRL